MRIFRAAIPLLTVTASLWLAGHPVQGQGNLPAPGVFNPQTAAPAAKAANPAQQHLMKGMDYSRKGKWNDAIVEFKAVIKLVPNSPVGYYQLASAYMAKNDLKSAEPQLKKVMQLDPKNVTVRVQLMQMNLQLNDPAEAVSLGQQAVKAKPKDSRIHFMLGVAYLLQKNASSAIKEFKTVTQLEPKNVGAYFNLGLLYKDKQQYALARQALAKAMALQPKDQRTLGLLADVELNADKVNGPKKAIGLYKKALAANSGNPQLMFSLGMLYERTKDNKLALDLYQKVIAKVPTFTPAKVNAARILLADKTAKDPKPGMKKAKGYLAEAAKQAPNSPQVLAMLGYAEISLGETANAETHYKRALQLAPDNIGVVEGLAYVYQTTNKPKESLAMVEKLRALQPDSVSVALRLAGLYENGGDIKKSGALYQEIVEKFPKDTEAMNARAGYLQRQKLTDKAADQYRAVLKIKPDDLDTQMRLAGLYSTSEEKTVRDKAIPELEAAKKLAIKGKAPKDDKEYDSRIEPFNSLAQLYEKNNEHAKAADQFNQFLLTVPKSAQAHQGLALLYAKDPATYDKALDEYRQLIALQPDNRGYYSQLAQAVKKKTGKDEDEFNEYRKLIEADPKNMTPRYVFADTIVSREGAPLDEAVKQYEEILKAKPNDGPAMIGLARAYEKQKKTDEAIEQYKKAILADPKQSYALRTVQPLIAAKNDPKITADWLTFLKSLMGKKDAASPAFYTMFMDEYSKANRGPEAVTALEEAYKANAKDALPLLAIGGYYSKQSQPAKAMATYKRVLSADGVFENNKGDAYKGMGDIYFSQNKFADALKAYQNWKSRQMFFYGVDQTQIRIAQCMEYLGQTDKALTEYNNLAKGAPDNAEIQEGLKRLNPKPATASDLMTPGTPGAPPMPGGIQRPTAAPIQTPTIPAPTPAGP
jgi:tetratricopeptide (TPR) repeat protein